MPVEEGTGESFSQGIPAGDSDSDSGSGGSVLGSIIAGLVVGGILFAIGYGPYKRWKATHPKGRAPGRRRQVVAGSPVTPGAPGAGCSADERRPGGARLDAAARAPGDQRRDPARRRPRIATASAAASPLLLSDEYPRPMDLAPGRVNRVDVTRTGAGRC